VHNLIKNSNTIKENPLRNSTATVNTDMDTTNAKLMVSDVSEAS